MSKDKPDFQIFPQSYLLHYVAHSTPNDGPIDSDKVFGFLDERLKIARLGPQSHVKLAKLKGAYMPEALVSTIMSNMFFTKKPAEAVRKVFLHLDNHKFSALTPEVRLYRVSVDGSNVRPFYFPTVSDYKFLAGGSQLDMGDSSFTSNGAIIESFSVTYTGKSVFQASRAYVEADLVVKLDNIAIAFDTPSEEFAPLVDLFITRLHGDKKTPNSNKTTPADALETGKNCRIVATIGYTEPRGGILTSKERKVIRNMFQAVSLGYDSHSVDIEQNGAAKISVKYRGFLESIKGETHHDVISSIKTKARIQKAKVGNEQERPRQNVDDLFSRRADKDGAKSKAESTTRDEVLLPSSEDTNGAFGSLINTLYNTGKLDILPPSDPTRRKFMAGLTTPDSAEGISATKAMQPNATNTSANRDLIKTNLSSFSEKDVENLGMNPFQFIQNGYITYFTIGDLLDAYYKKIGDDIITVAKSIEKEEESKLSKDHKKKCLARTAELLQELKTMHVLTSDVVYTRNEPHSKTLEQRTINISDIPVSIDTFYTLVFKQITKPRRSFYDMNDFITDFIPTLLTNSFSTLPGADFINQVTFKTTLFTSKKLSSSSIKKGKVFIDDIPSPLMSSSKTMTKDLAQYIVIHQEPSRETKSFGSGNEEIDLTNGIYHLRANQNSGIIKNITFSKIPKKGLEAYMLVRNGNMFDHLRFAHNARLEMIGNNLFYPGQLLYINPETLGFGDPRTTTSAARRLGFGGYYSTGPVTTTYSGGKLSTSAELYFESFPSQESETKVSNKKRTSIKEIKK